MKVVAGQGRGMLGAGAVSAYGAAVGDRVIAVIAQLPGGEMEYCDSGWFETVVTVADQVQQLLPLFNTFARVNNKDTYTGVDGQTLAAPHTLGTRRQLAQNPGEWKFVFIMEESRAMIADGAVAIKDGAVYITKGTAAALTLADPTAITDDGKELSVISTTAAAHTLSNAAGSGFNNGGGAKDVATFGGAIGDSLRLRAYGGKWLVVGSVNVTLG